MLKKEHFIRAKKQLLVLVVCLALVLPAAFFVYRAAGEREREAVLKAAREFLDAEIRRDYAAVYACFASSSPYVRSHSYDEYLAQAKSFNDRVSDYRIVAVSYIQNNNDRETYPAVEKVAQVEIDVTFLHEETNLHSEMNIGFIFFKEQGKWYKS